MLRVFLIVGLLLSVVFVSGCLEQMTDTGAVAGEEEAQLEDQAADMIEQEMEDAIEGITLEDMEDSIIE